MKKHNHHQGLDHDLQMLATQLSRRKFLGWVGAVGGTALVLPVLGCGSSTATDVDATTTTGDGGSCSTIPEETAGPYPGDGSNNNGLNALTLSGIVRSDIRSSLTTSTVAPGVPLTTTLTLVSTKNGCAPLVGYAVYLWHCDRAGLYSMYSNGITNENYLRGVQVTDANGQVTFTSIFPAAYSGRWPHIHFEIYASLAKATSATNKIKTSQLALPKAACETVFATTGYSASVTNLAQTSLATDNVFSDDGGISQLANVTGTVAAGMAATLTLGGNA